LRQFWGTQLDFNDRNDFPARASFTGAAANPRPATTGGGFAFGTVNGSGANMLALGPLLLQVQDQGDPMQAVSRFAISMTQKLCFYANSAPCLESDPEFQRIVKGFRSSKFSWAALVADLFSSPLVTNATHTVTFDQNGEVVAVARRDHLCAALDSRLGFTDVCGLHAVTPAQARAVVPSIAAGLPSDGYGRGSVAPVLPNQPTLFYRAGLENICAAVAAQTIDVAAAKQPPNVKQWTSKSSDAAITDFVSIVMGLAPSDARTGPATDLLTAHFSKATAGGATASNALKSTFVVACLAPSSVSIGL